MTVEEAQAYGKFLVRPVQKFSQYHLDHRRRYSGRCKTGSMACFGPCHKSQRPQPPYDLSPRGRTTSADYYNDAEWLDFNMFQSGHRRYGQRGDDKNYPIPENTEEDNWRYVERSLAKLP